MDYVHFRTEKKEDFASITCWRHSNQGLFAQHLVSTGNPYLSLKVMMKAQYISEHGFGRNEIQSGQNWFRPDNRYAYRVFASMFEKLGPEKASLILFQYLHLPLKHIRDYASERIRVEELTETNKSFLDFVINNYGLVFTKGEELDRDDIQLKGIGKLFKQYECEKHRKIVVVKDNSTEKILAAAIANRAPIGLNFSFLENRAYYILDGQLGETEREEVLKLIHCKLKSIYEDFPLQIIPIVTDKRTADQLTCQGALLQRAYFQSIWLRPGFRQWYEHIESFLKKIETRISSNI